MPLDVTTRGIDRLPDARQRSNVLAVLQAILEPLDATATAGQRLADALALNGGQTLTFTLDLLGQLLALRRQVGQSNEDYLTALLGRVVARQSYGTLPDIKAVAAFIAEQYGDGGYYVYSPQPKTVIVGITGMTTTADVVAIVSRLLLDSIGEVDRLQLFTVGGAPFTWDTAGLGWDQGLWSELVFTTD